MITVAGFNTAIDRFIHLDALIPGQVHRARGEQVYPGGKGVHVAQTIAALGERVQLVGLIDAPHRNLIQRRMSERGVLFHGVEVAGELRHCLALQDAEGTITEVLGQGPLLGQAEHDALLLSFRRSVEDSELVILSGSVPRGFATTVYAELIDHVKSAGKRCLVDASGDVMRHAVAAKPFLVKPNRDEISEWIGRAVEDLGAAKEAALALRDQGIAMPVVTLGGMGAVAADDSGVWHARLEAAQVRNSVGSGDCFLAGMAVAMQRHMPLEHALRLGVACGVANAQSEETGFVERSSVDALLAAVEVRRLM
ncbi:1-phosphofructokinase family hexose kinase [Dyella psychrodurans]|uniref:Phosphofructokinase n=1 Tax=Dyella psychrodurans TaxID=1927960 RepID=A0A370XE01_9GAMM|nr:1-phosphofructokinase family hexose kinase [Dyella psychrodurans]RDS86638.1 1-phosphofructokinase family hexose kinase [Dyella psychrodurans]